MAPILKGIVVIAVEDDAILMQHGYFDISVDEWPDVNFSPLAVVDRPLPATSDGIEPQEGTSSEHLIDWRERAPEMALDYIKGFVGECLDAGKAVDGIGISIFGNVMQGSEIVRYAPSQGNRKAVSIPLQFREELQHFVTRHEGHRSRRNPLVCVENDATAMAFGESIIDAERPKLFSCIWLGKGINAGLVTEEIGSWKGFMHPEMGHFFPRFHPDDGAFLSRSRQEDHPTSCAIHRDCLMGLISRRAILNRQEHGMAKPDITRIVAEYIAQLCVAITYITAPGRIAIGGYILRSGLLDPPPFFAAVRARFNELVNSFPQYAQIAPGKVSEFIVPAYGLDEGWNASALLGVKEMLKARLKAALESRESAPAPLEVGK